MAVFRVHKTRDFTVMSNHHLRDKNLTLKAKGLLSVILSLPDDWKYSIAGMAAICKEGTSAVKSALDELADSGYVTVTKLYPNQTKSGRIEYVYDIHETPQGCKKQGIGNLPLENQQVENRSQSSTEKPSTNEPNTKEDIPFSEIVGYLNEKAGTHYRAGTSKTKEHIRARWREGFRLDDFKRVIDVKCAEWLGTDFEKYLCPETLFGTKFEKYANQPMTRSRAKEGKGRNDAYDFDRKHDSSTVTHQHDAYDWSGYDDIRF